MSEWDEPYAVAVGDVVWEYYASRSHESTVVKVGRTLIHIQDPYGRVTKYRRSDRQRHGAGRGFGYFVTLNQKAQREWRAGAIAALRRHGLEIRDTSVWTNAKLEKLARFLEEMEPEDQ